MSEPTYRVELTHRPENAPHIWQAVVYRNSDDRDLKGFHSDNQEEAFDKAQAWVRVYASHAVQQPRTIQLSEDGDILDPHEVQR